MSDVERRPRTVEEHFQRFLSEIGQEGSRYGEAHFLPFQIESLALKNIGPFEKFEAKIRRDSVNIIHGPAGSGKSYIIGSILLAFGRRSRYFQGPYFNVAALEKGAMKLRIFPGQDSIHLTGLEREESIKGYQCLIADDFFQAVPDNMMNIVQTPSLPVELHRRLNMQIIVTAPSHFDTRKLPAETRIISLENYPHYR